MSFLNSGNNKCGLIIGINYVNDMDAKLNGCINDTKRITNFLKTRCGYQDENIQIITDDTTIKPTKNNIINAIKMLVKKVKETNSKEVWFSYSGHGSYINSSFSSEETDSRDEALVPTDYATSGLIRDDLLYEILVKELPKDCHLFSIIDSCHSGTALDLPYIYRTDTGIKQQREVENLANIIKLSGCRDTQTSMDAFINGKYQGALTFAFLKCMDDLEYNFTPKNLVRRCKHYLNSNNYEQIPTMTFSKPEFLNEIVMGEGEKIDYNIHLQLEGDSWCKEESSWNILSLTDSKLLFEVDRRFYSRNEKINYGLNLPDGKYILILKDSYGDGGIVGKLSYFDNKKLIRDFNFSAGTYQSVEFNVSSSVMNSSKKEVKIQVKGDYYARSESSWNIRDSMGNYIFNQDKTFDESNEFQSETINLEPGIYFLKCIDSYGDGGLQGTIDCICESKNLLKFKWVNLDWNSKEGYLKYYKFTV